MTDTYFYSFTPDQLIALMEGTIQMYVEYRTVHGYNPNQARLLTVVEMLDGLQAEQQLFASGEFLGSPSQILE